MPSFTINNYGDDYINIRVRPSSPYTAYRVYVRLASSSSAVVYDEWYSGMSSTFDVYVDGLDPGTEYAVNVAYNTSPTATGAEWIGTDYVTTDGSGPGPDPGGGPYYATIRFNANGGRGAPDDVEGETDNDDQYVRIRIPSDEPYRDGYIFLGWAFDDPSATRPDYYPGDYITVYGSESGEEYWLDAVWEEEQGGGAWIWNGGWYQSTPWVWDNGWTTASSWVWDGYWKQGV